MSDADLTVVVDTVDDGVADGLRRAWIEAQMGCANVYGADEVPLMAREAIEMYTINAVVLWGTNPFTRPTQADFAADLARAAESVDRNARGLDYYPWLTLQEQSDWLTTCSARMS
jgi:hypothetical protein